MNDEVVKQILEEIRKIRTILEENRNEEKQKKDLEGCDFTAVAEACNKVGNS